MRLLVALAFLLLAGCGSTGLSPLAADRVTARFPPHGLANVIAVDALSRRPLTRALLVAADGRTSAATDITVARSPGYRHDQGAANHPFSGNIAGLGPQQSPGPVPTGAAPQTESRLLEMQSTATLRLPDPAAYNRDWRRYRIRLTFGRPPGAVESMTIPAPAPLAPRRPRSLR